MRFLFLLFLTWGIQAKHVERNNPMENEGLFEGDIMGIDPSQDRNAIPLDSQRWPGGVIPYELDRSAFDIRQDVKEAMTHIEERSCIRFVRRTNEKDYILIHRGSGCWSYWGRLQRGEQKVSLGYGCEYLGTIVHELMHAIGFQHEHTRSDRDDYLYINFYNIMKGHEHNFEKLQPHENRLLTDFDFDSIMLYGSNAFAKDRKVKTMEAKDGRKMIDVPDKPGLSRSDIERIKILYECEVHDPMINDDLFEGDIMGIDPDLDKNAVARDSMRWPAGIIPYEIDNSLDTLNDAILKAMKEIMQKSCIRFVPRTTQRHYIRIFRGTGCWSYWGFLGTGEQDVSLGRGCEPHGTIVHELMHAIGFEHEHNRSDRDDCLIINWDNIPEKWFNAFKKLRPEQNRLLTEFDFDSIMLYGQYSFSRQRGELRSMEAKDGRFMPEVYNKKGLSSSDVQRLKILYQCEK